MSYGRNLTKLFRKKIRQALMSFLKYKTLNKLPEKKIKLKIYLLLFKNIFQVILARV